MTPTSSSQPVAYAVIGAGAFGSNHLRVLQQLAALPQPPDLPHSFVRLAAIVESHPQRAQALASAHPGVRVFTRLDDCLAAHATGDCPLHAASVCVPTSAHADVATALLTAGIDVLVEKPIAATLDQADALIALARHGARILQVGHLERFNPAVLAVQPYIHLPMFFEAHRLSIFTARSLDVDVVLDLMIHDLDIVLSLVQSPVHSLQAVGLPVLSRMVDIANVRVEFASGCVANFTASRVSTERVRKLRFFQPHQYVSIDYARQDLLFIDVKPDVKPDDTPDVKPDGTAPGPANALAGLNIAKPAVNPGEPLRLEIESFLNSVRTRTPPHVSGHNGRRALALALDINQAIQQHATRANLERFV